ncbi:hypothetical protein ACFW9D_05645 [Streptomyces sp. NPDC059524]|uniref:hypothetical protein n=1 Tax=Streptomyces sp. NPDC059524 TaxID=3346856 RepID=UPI0036CA8678
MADEPSNGELGRLIESMRGDFHHTLGQLNARLDRLVSADVYAVEKAALAKDIGDLDKEVQGIKRQREQDAQQITQTRRWLVASVIIPMIGLALPVILFLVGGN